MQQTAANTLPNELKSNNCSTEIHVWNVLSTLCRHTQVTTWKSGRKPQSFGRVQEVANETLEMTRWCASFNRRLVFSFFFLYWFGYTKNNVSHAKIISCQTRQLRQVNSQFFSRVADYRHRLLVFCFSKFVCVCCPYLFLFYFFSLLFSNKTDHNLMIFFR